MSIQMEVLDSKRCGESLIAIADPFQIGSCAVSFQCLHVFLVNSFLLATLSHLLIFLILLHLPKTQNKIDMYYRQRKLLLYNSCSEVSYACSDLDRDSYLS